MGQHLGLYHPPFSSQSHWFISILFSAIVLISKKYVTHAIGKQNPHVPRNLHTKLHLNRLSRSTKSSVVLTQTDRTLLYLYTVQTTSTKTKPCQKKLLPHFRSNNVVTKFSKVWFYHAVLLTLTKGQKSHDVTANSKLFSDYTAFYNNKEHKAHYKAKNQNTVKTNFHECACVGTELSCPKETSHQVSSQ